MSNFKAADNAVLSRSLKCFQRGRTLLEMVITVAVIGILASVAMPSYAPTQESQIELAVAKVADAARFARERAKTIGSPHGVEVDSTSQRLRVFSLDINDDPSKKIFDVYHPVSKQLYSLNFKSAPLEPVMLRAISGPVPDSCMNTNSLVFDAYGAVTCLDPMSSRFFLSTISLDLNGVARNVTVHGLHGRVTVE